MDQSRVMDIFAYYLSEHDMEAFNALGFNTRTSGFEGIAALYGKKANYLKRLRDEYDVVTSSERMGQRNRPPRERIKKTAKQLSRFSFDDLTQLAKALIEAASPTVEQEVYNEKNVLPADASEDSIESILNALRVMGFVAYGTRKYCGSNNDFIYASIFFNGKEYPI